MAFGIKQWIGLTALGFAAIAIWRLPPAPFTPGQSAEVIHEETRYRALSSELARADATLKRIRWADSLSALVVENGQDDIAFAVPSSIDLTSTEIEQIRARAARDLEGIVRYPNMALGHIYQPVSHGSADDTRLDRRGRDETYVGTRDGVNYCFRVRVSQDDKVAENVRYHLGFETDWRSPLGLCSIYAAHGMPGGDIARWLESGGVSYGSSQGPRRRTSSPIRGRTGPFGYIAFQTRDGLMDDKCLAGLADACASLFVDPVANSPLLAPMVAIAQRSPALSIGDYYPLTGEAGYLLADLEEEFGAERFQAFWTSEAPVDEAFESAFGAPVGQWMVSWMGRSFKIDPPGPQLAKSTSSAAFLTLGLFVLVAYLRNRRRELS